ELEPARLRRGERGGGVMGDILNKFDAAPEHGGSDPVRRIQQQLKPQLPKRFYKEAAVVEADGGFTVQLDGKPIRTPGKALLTAPSRAAAQLIADEFSAQG